MTVKSNSTFSESLVQIMTIRKSSSTILNELGVRLDSSLQT